MERMIGLLEAATSAFSIIEKSFLTGYPALQCMQAICQLDWNENLFRNY